MNTDALGKVIAEMRREAHVCRNRAETARATVRIELLSNAEALDAWADQLAAVRGDAQSQDEGEVSLPLLPKASMLVGKDFDSLQVFYTPSQMRGYGYDCIEHARTCPAIAVDEAVVERACIARWPSWKNASLQNETDRKLVLAILTAALAGEKK